MEIHHLHFCAQYNDVKMAKLLLNNSKIKINSVTYHG